MSCSLVSERSFTNNSPPLRHGNDERGALPVFSRCGLCRTDRNLARRDECGCGQYDDTLTPFLPPKFSLFCGNGFVGSAQFREEEQEEKVEQSLRQSSRDQV